MTLQGQRQLEARLKAMGQTRSLMQGFQMTVIAEAKRLVPRKTGFLGRAIVPGAIDDDSATVTVNASYAAAVEFGSRPHTIVPRKASILAWPASPSGRRLSGQARTKGGKPAGKQIFARKVNHPGSRAQPFLVPAAVHAVGKFRDAIIARWNDAA